MKYMEKDLSKEKLNLVKKKTKTKKCFQKAMHYYAKQKDVEEGEEYKM